MGLCEETLRRRRADGLPRDFYWKYFGGYDRFKGVPVNMGLCPAFERETIEETTE